MNLQPVRHGDTFGDTVLVQVLYAKLFGEGGPGQFDKTPPGGYPVGGVARAVVLVCDNKSHRQISL